MADDAVTGLSEGDILDYFFGDPGQRVGDFGPITTPSGTFDFKDVLGGLGKILSGTSSFGKTGQLLGAGGIGVLLNRLMGGGQSGPAGYRGGIPEYTVTRTQTPIAQQRPEGYRPGQGGITYFNPVQYTYTGRDLAPPTVPAAATTNTGTTGGTTDTGTTDPQYKESPGAASGGYMPNSGIAALAGGRFLRGPGDGVSDSIPARFAGSGRPARLADGEFVIDARTVSEIGNGSSEAGARKLYEMMDRVHKARRTAKRGKKSRADKYLPA
jgi:hypothetical protein